MANVYYGGCHIGTTDGTWTHITTNPAPWWPDNSTSVVWRAATWDATSSATTGAWITLGDANSANFVWTQAESKADRLKRFMRERMAPAVHVRASPPKPADAREIAARETLRRIVGEQAYRDYLRTGRVSVRGASGDLYRVGHGHAFTEVWRNGKQIGSLCVVLSGDFPPTDAAIMRYILIASDEGFFRSKAVRHVVVPRQAVVRAASEPLVEFARRLAA